MEALKIIMLTSVPSYSIFVVQGGHMNKQKSEKIETLRKKFKNRREWLLIAVDEIDKATTTALKGRLIAHSPSRDEIYKKSISYRGLTMVEFAGSPSKDVAIIFLNLNHA